MDLGPGQKHDALNQVVDVTEAPGLTAVSVHGERLTAQRLHQEVGDNATVIGVQARTIRVENAGQMGVHAARAMKCHDESFGKALSLVVD